MKYIFNLINKVLFSICGLQIINIKKRNRYNLENTILNLLNLLKKSQKIIIFDVGGNRGRFIEIFTNILKKINHENYEIHYFEPIKFLHDHVKEKNFKNVFCNNFALGDKNQFKKFYEYQLKESLENRSSKFPIRGKSSFNKFHFDNIDEKKHNKIQYKSKIVTIDSYCKKKGIKNINFLKIDTQGYNIQTLVGGSSLLKKELIDIIYTELTISKRYQEQETIFKLEKVLGNKYELFGLDLPYMVQVHSRFLQKNLNLDIFYSSKKILKQFNKTWKH